MEGIHTKCYEAFKGKVDGMALDLNKNISTIYKWTEDPEGSGSPIPGNLIIPACKSAGNTLIVEWLANRLGLITYRLPDLKHSSDSFKLQARMIKEFGETVQAIAESMEDGKISKREMEGIEKEGFEAMTAIKIMIEVCRDQIR